MYFGINRRRNDEIEQKAAKTIEEANEVIHGGDGRYDDDGQQEYSVETAAAIATLSLNDVHIDPPSLLVHKHAKSLFFSI